MKRLIIALSFTAFLLLSACELFNNLTDIVPPDPVTGLGFEDNFTSGTLSWTRSFSSDVKNLELSWTGQAEPVLLSNSDENYTIEGLIPATEYTFSLVVIDEADNRSTPSEITVPMGGINATEVIFFDDFDDSNWDSSSWDVRGGGTAPVESNGVLRISGAFSLLMHFDQVLGAGSDVSIMLGMYVEDSNGDGDTYATTLEIAEPSASAELLAEDHELISFYAFTGTFNYFDGTNPNPVEIGSNSRVSAGTEQYEFHWDSSGISYRLNGTEVGAAAMTDLFGAYFSDPAFSYSGGYVASYNDGFKFLLNHLVADTTEIDYILIYQPE